MLAVVSPLLWQRLISPERKSNHSFQVESDINPITFHTNLPFHTFGKFCSRSIETVAT